MEIQIWCRLHCGFVWERAQKRYNGHCLQFCMGGSCPPALALMPDTSVPPCVPLVPFKVLPWYWSLEGVSLCKSMCGDRPSKRRGLRVPQFLLPPQPPWFLQPEVMDTYLPGTGTLGWVVWCGSGITCSRDISLFYIQYMWAWDHQFVSSCLHPSIPLTQLDDCDFFNSCVVRLPQA